VKSNIDGSKPLYVTLFVADKDRLESFKFHSGDAEAALVTAKFDWSIFSPSSLESWRIFRDGTKKPMASLRYEPEQRAALVAILGWAWESHKPRRPRLATCHFMSTTSVLLV
jgi:hypothetical protein